MRGLILELDYLIKISIIYGSKLKTKLAWIHVTFNAYHVTLFLRNGGKVADEIIHHSPFCFEQECSVPLRMSNDEDVVSLSFMLP